MSHSISDPTGVVSAPGASLPPDSHSAFNLAPHLPKPLLLGSSLGLSFLLLCILSEKRTSFAFSVLLLP